MSERSVTPQTQPIGHSWSQLFMQTNRTSCLCTQDTIQNEKLMIEATNSGLRMSRKKHQINQNQANFSKYISGLVLTVFLILFCHLIQASEIGPLWLTAAIKPAPKVSARLEEVLARVGPNMRASADYRDFRDIKLNETLEGWRALHERVSNYANKQAQFHKPAVLQLLKESNVSLKCWESADRTLDAIGHLQSWAVQMWSYSGNFPPTASFAGHYHDVGSYKGCIDLSEEKEEAAEGQKRYLASYCTIGFRPIVPVRPRFHLIFNQPPAELVNLFNSSDILAKMASDAQYFHYIYLRTGVCVPSECSAYDMQQISRLIGRKLALMPAPVKCFSQSNSTTSIRSDSKRDYLDNLENSEPIQVDLNEKMNYAQMISLIIIGIFFLIVLIATVWHAVDLTWTELVTTKRVASSENFDDDDDDFKERREFELVVKLKRECDRSSNNNGTHQTISIDQVPGNTSGKLSSLVVSANCFKAQLFYYFSMFVNVHEFCDTKMRSNEIECLHGFRVGTMLWIICVHVLQYNDWSGFTRIYENVPSLQNPFLHPIINANYVVDNFFLMSGLLAAYTTWHSNKGVSVNFSMFRSLLARYLRLTPQVLLISLMYIALPLIGQGGPFWYDMTHYASKYCEKNWWVNLLHLQAFYNTDEICNLVGWWISVDMFYYFIGITVLWMILAARMQMAYLTTGMFVGFSIIMTIWRHYSWGLSPNNLGLVAQVNEVWTEFVVKFFWSPYPHAYVFFLGLWLGYLMANKIGLHQVRRWSRWGWFLSLTSLTAINLSSRLWLIGALEVTTDQQVLSTGYNVVCVIVWASSFGWMIVACHYGCAPLLNRLLSIKANVMLSKASFIIYLSHMLVLRTFYGTQYNLFEVSMSILIFLVAGITFLSVLFGVFLCVAFEAPCMKLSRFVMSKIDTSRKLPPAAQNSANNPRASTSNEEKATLNANPSTRVLFK